MTAPVPVAPADPAEVDRVAAVVLAVLTRRGTMFHRDLLDRLGPRDAELLAPALLALARQGRAAYGRTPGGRVYVFLVSLRASAN